MGLAIASPSMTDPAPPALAFLYTVRITLDPPLHLGATPQGERRIIGITGGRFEGPRMRGRLLPGGADWQVRRPDGVFALEARMTFETADGALIYVTNTGLRHGPPEVMARLLAGEAVDPALYFFRMTPRFETAHPDYAWLNRVIAIGSGRREKDAVAYDAFEVL